MATVPVLVIDDRHDPALSQVARDVRETNTPRVIRLGDEDVAIISPITRSRRRRKITDADRDAFLGSLGGWRDLDTDRLLKDIYDGRQLGERPAVEL